MRTKRDRIRHAVLFEIASLCLLLIGFALFSEFDMDKMGVLGIGFSLLTVGWNYIFNYVFDKSMIAYTGSTDKKNRHRIIHVLLFETILLFITIPIVSWYLNMTLFEAINLEIGIIIFYFIFTYIYNIVYDYFYPIRVT